MRFNKNVAELFSQLEIKNKNEIIFIEERKNMSLQHPIDHGGFRLLEGYQGIVKESGTDDGRPWETYHVQVVPISGSSNNELYVISPIHSGSSISDSSGFVVYGSGSDGLPHPVGVTQNADGTWSLQTDTELILSGNVVISNVKVYSVDGTSGSLVYGLAAPNGAVYVTSSIAGPVHEALETGEDVLTFDLTAARTVPGTELLTPEGVSVSGRSLTIKKLTGSVKLRWNVASYVRTTLTGVEYGTLEFVALTKKIIRTVGDWTDTTPEADNYSKAGTKITIAGSAGNDGTYTVVSATATDLVVAEALANEAASATETVTGYYPRRSDDYDALAWPNMVTLVRRFDKLFLENVAQAGATLVLYVGKD